MRARSDLDHLAAELSGRTPLRDSLLLFTVLAAVAAAFAWASLARVDDITRAPGRVVPAGDVQIVQAPDDGVIRAIHIAEGDVVELGAALMELDGLVQTSQFDREVQRALALRAKIERLTAEIEERPLAFATDLTDSGPDLVASEQALFLGRAGQLADEIAVLTFRLEQSARETDEVTSDLAAARQIAGLLEEQRQIIEPLVRSGVEPRLTLIDLQRQEQEQANRIARAEASLARLDLAREEIETSMAATRSRYRAEALSDLAQATAELASLRPALPALESLAARAVLRAPVRGVVNQMQRRSVGGSVRRGEAVAEIVPLDDDLQVQAFIRPQDIAFIRVGEPVRVKITAYDFTRYGALDGTISRIGASTIRIEDGSAGEVFVADIRTAGAILDGSGATVQILPGMTAEVDILAGERRVIDYLLQPIERLRDKAFSE